MRPPGFGAVKAVATVTIDLGGRAERDARAAAGDAARWATLSVLDTILASPVADEAVDRVLASHWAERTAVQVVDGEQTQRALAAALESPAFERALSEVLTSRVVEEAIAGIIDRALTQLPQSPALWSLIDEIAASPAVRAAIGQQGVGLAGELAEDVRARSRRADDQLENAARRFLHWRRGGGPVPEPGA